MILLFVLILGLASSGLTNVIRAIVPQEWLLVKPWSCDLCMSFHGVWVMGLVTFIDSSAPMPTTGECGLLLTASTAVSLVSTKIINRLAG